MDISTMFVSCNFKDMGNYVESFNELCNDATYGDVLYISEFGGYKVFLRAEKSIIQLPGQTSYDSIILADFKDFMTARAINPERSVLKLTKKNFMKLKNDVDLNKFIPSNRVVSFMGQMGSGKSEAARIAINVVQSFVKEKEGHYPAVHSISFADSLRSCCANLLTLFDVEREDDFLQRNHKDGQIYYPDHLKSNHLKTSRIYGLKKNLEELLDHPEIDMADYHLRGLLYQSMLKLINTVGEIEMPLEETPIFESSKSQQDIMVEIARFMIQFSELCKTNEFTVRNLLQLFGTNFVRDNIDKSFHTNRLKAEIIREYYRNCTNQYKDIFFFIDDVRFENEAELIKSIGGIVIGIKRDSLKEKSTHPSEQTSREKWDRMASVTIDNNGSVDELRSRINETLKDLPGYLGA